jgi:hypothetical protein
VARLFLELSQLKLFCFKLLTCSFMAAGLANAETLPANSKLVASVFNEVYQIKIATDSTAPKAAYGSCFVVDTAGLLATNFHVVAFALHDPEKYHLFLLDGDQIIPAEVVAFDAVNDIAIVRVDKIFPKAVRWAPRLPDAGDKIYSIGWPEDLNKAVSEGNFNGLMTAGPYRKIQMSIPLNPGMSGGPTINELGEVIGVNVSLRADSQSLAFAVPQDLLRSLMKKKPVIFSRPEDHDTFDEEMRSQIEQVQEQLTATFLKGGSGNINIGGWQVLKPNQMVKCWHSQESGARDETLIITEQCYLSGATSISRYLDTGTFRLKYQAVENRSLNQIQFVHSINESLDELAFNLTESVDKFTTKIKCHQLDLLNAYKVPMRVHYCVNSYIPYAESYNLEFEVVTINQGQKAFLVAGSFLGFSSHNVLAILRTLINSIRPESR